MRKPVIHSDFGGPGEIRTLAKHIPYAFLPVNLGGGPTPRTMDETTAQRVFQVLWQMKKDGYSENTIKPIARRLRNLAKRADLDKPEQVKEFIGTVEWSNGYKENMVGAYNHYAVFHSLDWKKPKYQRTFSIEKLLLEF